MSWIYHTLASATVKQKRNFDRHHMRWHKNLSDVATKSGGEFKSEAPPNQVQINCDLLAVAQALLLPAIWRLYPGLGALIAVVWKAAI